MPARVLDDFASRSAIASMSASLPTAMFQASWIISWEPTAITVSSQVTAITDAADAAMPSTTATVRAG